MLGRGDIYTVHENDTLAEPSERIVLVREGFSFWAFIFTILWLLYHRCWRLSAAFIALAVLIELAGDTFHLAEFSIAALQLGLQFWLGCAANDCRRAALTRSGFDEIGVVCAESELLAERRYFDRLHPAV